MKNQPNRDYNSNDRVMTPPELCDLVVNYFEPRGIVLEPFCGSGNFRHALSRYATSLSWCEIDEGRDFFEYSMRCDWIVTNPPWSRISDALRHSCELADNIVFLQTVNHIFTTCRERIVREAGFALKEIFYVDWPKEFPKSGFLLGAVHWQKGYKGDVKITDKRTK